MKFKCHKLFLILILIVIASSCVPRKEIAYFQGIEMLSQDSINRHSIVLKPNDLLSITVSSDNIESVRPFNLIALSRPVTGVSNDMTISSGSSQEVPYLVDSDGAIHFPVLGAIQAQGLTPKELRENLTTQLKEYIKDPIVNIRILNFTVSVLGEVSQPGTYTVSGERIALPEALGLAGDLTIYGQRNNILVVREADGKKTFRYLDLRNADVLNSDFYYLQQHDVVYVEPNGPQRQSASFNRNTTVYISIASLLLSVLVLIFR
jgi:polysaccharide export outer membrane protein